MSKECLESTFDNVDFNEEDILKDFRNMFSENVVEGTEIVINDSFIGEFEAVEDDDFGLETLPSDGIF